MVGRPRTRTVCHCGKPEQARGLCAAHYQQARRAQWAGDGYCSRVTCDRLVHAKGLCLLHYQRKQYGSKRPPCLPGRKIHSYSASGKCVHCHAPRVSRGKVVDN